MTKFSVVGALLTSPSIVATGDSSAPSLYTTINMGEVRNCAESTGGTIDIASPGSDVPLGLGTIASLSLLFLRVISGAIEVKLTSSLGTTQTFGLGSGGQALLSNFSPVVTAVALRGTGVVEYLAGGV